MRIIYKRNWVEIRKTHRTNAKLTGAMLFMTLLTISLIPYDKEKTYSGIGVEFFSQIIATMCWTVIIFITVYNVVIVGIL